MLLLLLLILFIYLFFCVDEFASYVNFILIIKLKKKKLFDFHLNSFFLFIPSSSQLKILSMVYYPFFYLPYNYWLYSSLLLSTLPTTLQVFFFLNYQKLNRFCVFVAFLLYTIWFLSTSFIDMLKFCIFVTDYAENINFCLS